MQKALQSGIHLCCVMCIEIMHLGGGGDYQRHLLMHVESYQVTPSTCVLKNVGTVINGRVSCIVNVSQMNWAFLYSRQ